MERLDRTLGRLLLRTWAVVAFVAALGSAAFGIVVLRDGQLPVILLLLLAALFAWLGLRAWRDRATLGEVLAEPGLQARPVIARPEEPPQHRRVMPRPSAAQGPLRIGDLPPTRRRRRQSAQ